MSKIVCWLEKPCKACRETKALSAFPKSADRKDGRGAQCKECRSGKSQPRKSQWRRPAGGWPCEHTAEFKARRQAQARARGTRPGTLIAQRYREQVKRASYSGTLEEYAEYIERYRMGCGGASSWNSWLPRRRVIRAARPAGKYAHLTSAEYYRLRYAERIEFRLRERMRRQFKKLLRGERKERPSFIASLSYSFAQLRDHLERQFSEGMSWDNCGEWHVDHRVPKNLFDPGDAIQVAACWALSNLRPLWKADNLRRPKDGSDLEEHEWTAVEPERQVNGSSLDRATTTGDQSPGFRHFSDGQATHTTLEPAPSLASRRETFLSGNSQPPRSPATARWNVFAPISV